MNRVLALVLAPVLAAALSGCISVLPKTKPDQLYVFGQGIGASSPVAPEASSAGVLLGVVGFPRASTGDGILTLTGSKSAYIAQARWVGPASILFREAVERSFDRKAQRSRLLSRGETGRSALVLRLDVRDFLATYPNGPETTPVILVSVRARLTRPDGVAVAERGFDIKKPATENRVGPIVDAFDAAVTEALDGVVTWTDQAAASLPPMR